MNFKKTITAIAKITLLVILYFYTSVSVAYESNNKSNEYIDSTQLISICKSSHKEGYARLYDYLRVLDNEKISLPWWPGLDLDITDRDFVKIDTELTQFKNPINAIFAEFIAPVGFRLTDEKLRATFPRLSHFIMRNAGVAIQNQMNSEILKYERALKPDTLSQDDGLMDARRHMIWAALLSKYLGIQNALCILALHEVDNTWNPAGGIFQLQTKRQAIGTVMDFFNNALGIMIGAQFNGNEDELKAEVDKVILEGRAAVLKIDSNEITMSRWWVLQANAKLSTRTTKDKIKDFIKYNIL